MKLWKIALLVLVLLAISLPIVNGIVIVGRNGAVVSLNASGGGGGTVTSVATGYGLQGGTITTTGNISALFSDFSNTHLHNAINLTNVAYLNNRITIDCTNITGGSDGNYCVDTDTNSGGTVTSIATSQPIDRKSVV